MYIGGDEWPAGIRAQGVIPLHPPRGSGGGRKAGARYPGEIYVPEESNFILHTTYRHLLAGNRDALRDESAAPESFSSSAEGDQNIRKCGPGSKHSATRTRTRMCGCAVSVQMPLKALLLIGPMSSLPKPSEPPRAPSSSPSLSLETDSSSNAWRLVATHKTGTQGRGPHSRRRWVERRWPSGVNSAKRGCKRRSCERAQGADIGAGCRVVRPAGSMPRHRGGVASAVPGRLAHRG